MSARVLTLPMPRRPARPIRLPRSPKRPFRWEYVIAVAGGILSGAVGYLASKLILRNW